MSVKRWSRLISLLGVWSLGAVGDPAPAASDEAERRALEAAMAKKRNELRFCYQATLGKRPDSRGSALVEFSLTADGAPKDLRVTAQTLPPDLVTCVTQRLAKLRLPVPASNDLRLTYPLEFDSAKDTWGLTAAQRAAGEAAARENPSPPVGGLGTRGSAQRADAGIR